MNWTGPAELRAQLQKQWDRGELLAGLVTGEPAFPQRLALKCPRSADMTEHFDAVRAWSRGLRELADCRVVMREFRHRVLGANAVPQEVWIDTLDEALALIGQQKAARRFGLLRDATRERAPQLLGWLARRPLRALALAGEWDRLLDVVAWLQAHPRPGIYVRQVDLVGVHSKFIDLHRGVLSELLDHTLPAEAVDRSASGSNQFAQRYGFLGKPLRIRFRILDPALAWGAAGLLHDVTLDAASFARLPFGAARVFITENEINFLALPALPNSIVLFGAGYGFEVLAGVDWLQHCSVHYWGDIDTHGFAILDQLRGRLAHVDSFLMDRATLMAFEPLWGDEDQPTQRELARLRPDEQSLYDDLRDNRLRKGLRLEQERIGFGWVEAALARLG